MTENKPFWMVVREGESANAPTKKHFTDEEAYTEAARLLKKDPHRRFWVMQAIGGVYNTMQMTTVQFKAPVNETAKVDLKDACSLREDVYLHPENKPELEGGCLVGGVKHTVKKKPEAYSMLDAHRDIMALGIKIRNAGFELHATLSDPDA